MDGHRVGGNEHIEFTEAVGHGTAVKAGGEIVGLGVTARVAIVTTTPSLSFGCTWIVLVPMGPSRHGDPATQHTICQSQRPNRGGETCYGQTSPKKQGPASGWRRRNHYGFAALGQKSGEFTRR